MVKEWFARIYSFRIKIGDFEFHPSNPRQDGPTRGVKRPRRETLKKASKKLKEDPDEIPEEEQIPEVEPLDTNSTLNDSVGSSSSDCRAEDNRWKRVYPLTIAIQWFETMVNFIFQFCDNEFRRILKEEREDQKSTLLSKWESNRRKNIKRIIETSKNDTVGIHPSIALERITSRKLREPDEDSQEAVFRMDFQFQRITKVTGKVQNSIRDLWSQSLNWNTRSWNYF